MKFIAFNFLKTFLFRLLRLLYPLLGRICQCELTLVRGLTRLGNWFGQIAIILKQFKDYYSELREFSGFSSDIIKVQQCRR